MCISKIWSVEMLFYRICCYVFVVGVINVAALLADTQISDTGILTQPCIPPFLLFASLQSIDTACLTSLIHGSQYNTHSETISASTVRTEF